MSFRINSLIIIAFVLLLSGCKEAKSTSEAVSHENNDSPSVSEVLIQAEDFNKSKGKMTTERSEETSFVITPDGDSWLAFDVDIPVAGRYKFEVRYASDNEETQLWMEDYIDNKDNRTYDITSKIKTMSGTDFQTGSKDGSPLNEGVHKMKLHINGGSAKIDWIKFTLMVPHKLTPKTYTQNMDGDEWKIAWSDEFDGEGLPDTSKWSFAIGDWGWGNNELQYYTENRIENARQEDGDLIIEARKDDMGKAWTSARLTTRGKETFIYGRIEIKAKVPSLRGNWAAGWTLGDEYVDELSWPYCGEIDILESVGYEMDDETGNGKAHSSVHCGAFYFKLGNHRTSTLEVENMEDEYHLYTIDWSPEGIVSYVDNQKYFEYTDTSTELSWPYDKAQNIILNLAIGGGWGGAQGLDENMTSQKYIIDYVRVYEKI